MANMLFKKQNPQPNRNNPNPMDQLNQIRKAGPSNILFNQMYQNNPQFKQFADSMKGKTPEQAFNEHGLNFDQFKNYKW